MITLVIVKNVFQPNIDRQTLTLKEWPQTVEKLLAEYSPKGVTFNATVNAYSAANDTVINDGDMIVIYPAVMGGGGGGKNIIGVVAAIALTVVSFGIGGVASGLAWGAAMSTWTTWGFVAAFAVSFLGSTLVSRFMTSKLDTGSYSSSTKDPTYNWGGVETMEGQNNAITLTYGTVKSGGQSIGKYINTLDNKEYLNWLVSAGEGPLTISNIKLNDNAVSYYNNVNVETREGTNNQTAISNFNDTYFTETLSFELTTTARTVQVQGNATQGIIVKVEFPSGLYYANDNGGLDTAWVKVHADYRLQGASTWTKLFEEQISGKQSSALRREWRVDNLASGAYEVQIYVISRSHETNNSRASVKCYWTGLTSIVYDDFTYPNIALVGIKALATDQISGTPSLSFIKSRAYIWAYNPTTAAYEQKDASNPAWACYDLVHHASRLYNINTGAYEFEVRGAPADLMIYSQFAEWAAFCDTKNLKINIEITTVSDLMKLINSDIAPIGRGFVLWFGTRCGCIWSCTKQASQMFGMGNIISGTFKEAFMDTADRANCLEITFNDAANDYERTPITVYADDYDNADTEKRTQVTMNGITSYDQAYREGKYELYCNKYLLRTINFETSVDAISCTIGDVIYVAHDVPEWSYSGRITAVGDKQLTLPVEVTDTSKSYQIMYRTVNDNRYTQACTIVSSGSGYTTVTVAADFNADDPPAVNDIFDLALVSTGSKPFTVQSISRTQDNNYKIEAIEYNANIYNESYTVPPLDYSLAEDKIPQNVTQLSAKQVAWKSSLGVINCRMYASWTLPQGAPACKFTVYLSTDGTNYTIAKSGISAYSTEFDTTPDTKYWVKVISTLNGRASSGTVTGPISAGYDSLPPDVNALHHELLANNHRRFWWDFTYPDINDIAGFKLKYTPNGNIGWDSALPLHEGLVTAQPFETDMLRQGAATVQIKAVDNAGNESANVAMLSINLGDVLLENVLYSKDLTANSWGDVTHDGYVDTTTGALKAEETSAMWSGPNNAMWSNPNDPMWVSQFKSFTATYSFAAPAAGQFWIDLAVTGPLNISYSVNGGVKFPYTQKVMVSAGDTILITMTAFAGSTQVSISKATVYIDVPDVVEHFNDIAVATSGTTLPIKCPDYYTTAVRIDAVENNAWVRPEIVTRNPCVIKLYDSTGAYVTGTVDVTWQGFRKELAT